MPESSGRESWWLAGLTYAQRLKEIIEKDPSHPYEVVCCVPTPEGTFQQEPPPGVQRFDSYKAIRRLLNTLALDIVLVADVNVPVKHWEALASLCEKELVQFKVVPSYFSILVSGLYLETLSGIPILGVSRLPLDRMFNKLVKRADRYCWGYCRTAALSTAHGHLRCLGLSRIARSDLVPPATARQEWQDFRYVEDSQYAPRCGKRWESRLVQER